MDGYQFTAAIFQSSRRPSATGSPTHLSTNSRKSERALAFSGFITADADAILLAVDTAQKPGAELVFVINGHPQVPRFDLPALQSVQGELKRLFGNHSQIRLPAIHEKFWGNFERAGMSVLDVSSADPADLINIAKADVDTVAMMQGRVEAWMNVFMKEVQPLLEVGDGAKK